MSSQVAHKEQPSAGVVRQSVPRQASNTGSGNNAHKDLSDGEVIRLYLQTHRSDYFSVLYQRYASKVFGKCISILKDYDEAKDAVQDIFVKIMTHLVNFGERAQFSTWIYSITYNYCIDVIRKKKKEKMLFTDDIERAPDVAEEEVLVAATQAPAAF